LSVLPNPETCHALSDAFVDNDVDYADIARRVRGTAPEVLERLFFHEVAPVCHANLAMPAPPVWTGFDRNWLMERLERRRRARQTSAWCRLKERLLVAWLRRRYAKEWKAIRREL
jgi:hypothetical protein